MLKFILKKLLLMIPMLVVISLIVYLGLKSTGVDPISSMIPPEVISQNPELAEQMREELGFNDPVIVQYARWLGNIVRGDFGYTLKNEKIIDIIAARLPYTLELSVYAMLFSAVIGIGIGIISAIRQNGIVDYIGRVLAVLGQAVPQFLVGIILIWIFSIKLGWFPASNRVSPDATNAFVDAFQHLFLPVTTLTIGMVAVLMRYARNTMLDVLNSDYIKTARSKGIPEWKVYIKHGFRNAMRPVLVILCFRLPMLIGGSVVIESVFGWPGIGSIITQSVVSGDYPVIMVTTLMVAVAILTASFLVDVLTAALDPRVRLGE